MDFHWEEFVLLWGVLSYCEELCVSVMNHVLVYGVLCYCEKLCVIVRSCVKLRRFVLL